jgi:hypothetical protein
MELKLVQNEKQAAETYPMERRRSERHRISGRVTALLGQTEPGGLRRRICSLSLVNLSDTGLGAVSQEAFELGSTIAVFFPPHGPERGFDLYGKVVRCVENGAGHEIGIQLRKRMAA